VSNSEEFKRADGGLHPKFVLVRILAVFVFAAIAITIALGPSHARNSSARSNHAPGRSLKRSVNAYTNRLPKMAGATLQPVSPPPVTSPEVVTLFAADCTTPKTAFVLGDTVCAKVEGGPGFARRVALIDSFPLVRQFTPITSDPQFISFTLPATPTSTINGDSYDNRGVWKVNIVPNWRFSVRATADFTVSDPQAPQANLAIFKSNGTGDQITAGSNVLFSVFVQNPGPDAAQNVTVTDNIPSSTSFLSGQQDDAGPQNTFNCTFPAANSSSGATTCTIASLPAGTSAVFSLIYNVDPGAGAGTVVANTSTVASDTADRDSSDNTATSSLTVIGGAAANTCTLECPDNVTAIANTTENSQRGAHVTFDDAVTVGDCGAASASPVSGSFFPVGSTTVTVTSESGGGNCTFTVTVIDNGTNPPTISCPANKTANADANCSANVTLGTPVTSGDNVTVVGSRSDGLPMYDCDANGENCVRKSTDLPFSTGVTTVTWNAYAHDTPGPYANNADEIAHRVGAASCTQTVTVVDVTPPTINSPNPTAAADANCQAAVPDFSTIAIVSDNCACASSDTSQICDNRQDIKVIQDVAPGTLVGLGAHTINLTANDGSSNNNGAGNSTTIQVTFTVVDQTPPVFTFVPPAVVAYTGPDATTCDTVVSDGTLGTATATDNCGSATITRSPSGNTFPVGVTTIVWTATDAAGNTSTANQTVTVIDNTPPVITLNGNNPSLWPPDHSYQTFAVTDFVASVSDNCGGVSVSDVVVEKATSDEVEDGDADGSTSNDIVIAANCRSVQLRSERSGSGDGRVYTITFRLTDTHGNVTRATANVVVPHNTGETPVDSGVHYTVNGSCP
jgi:uncharacterized repeat protein (TIGR01451 family)